MSIQDIIKKSFLEGFNYSAPSLKIMILCLLVSIILGAYIYIIYKICNSNSFYSRDFNLSLIMITVITCAIILTIQSSFIVSLGMVGALSIVRFRTAVKNSVDLTFMFWAIAVGIITGTGLIGLSVLVSFVLSVLILVFRSFPAPKKNLYLVRIETDKEESVKEVLESVRTIDNSAKIQSEDLRTGHISITLEIHTSAPEEAASEIKKNSGIQSVTIIAHGDNTSI